MLKRTVAPRRAKPMTSSQSKPPLSFSRLLRSERARGSAERGFGIGLRGILVLCGDELVGEVL